MTKNNKNIHCVIMAGGSGTRFWPKSRALKPKQLIELSGSGKTLLEETVARVHDLCPEENIHVITGENIKCSVKKNCSKTNKIKIIAEPKGRNTAPCIGYMAARISKISDPEDIMVIMPSDHLITEKKKFLSVLRIAVKAAAESNCFVTIGIKPKSAHTGYGYIQLGDRKDENTYKVRSFKEKPNEITAKGFLKDGNYLWNAGIFAVKAGVALKEIRTHLPELYKGLESISKDLGTKKEQATLKKIFPKLEAISIDFGVIEKLNNTLTVIGDFDWDDLGSWTSIEPLREKKDFGVSNSDNIVCLDAKNNIVDTNNNKKLIALLGVEDLLIIETDDALLIANKKYDQRIKDLVEELKKSKKKSKFL